MKHYNDFVIVGIDHGYGNIKTANTVTPTGITKLDAAPTFTKNTLFFEGSYYQIGEGHKEYLADKWQDEDNYLFTLMGIARELNRESITSAKVYLAVGLPITWVGRQRENFRQYMLQRESVDFKYEDKLYSVRIIGCYVYPQGYAAVVEKLNEMTGLSMIADIGNGTVNIIFRQQPQGHQHQDLHRENGCEPVRESCVQCHDEQAECDRGRDHYSEHDPRR